METVTNINSISRFHTMFNCHIVIVSGYVLMGKAFTDFSDNSLPKKFYPLKLTLYIAIWLLYNSVNQK